MAITQYTPTDWLTGDIITEARLDHIEQGIKNNSKYISDNDKSFRVEKKGSAGKNGLSTRWNDLDESYCGILITISTDPDACAMGFITYSESYAAFTPIYNGDNVTITVSNSGDYTHTVLNNSTTDKTYIYVIKLGVPNL